MDCKNCGFVNGEGSYFCQNCGAPLAPAPQAYQPAPNFAAVQMNPQMPAQQQYYPQQQYAAYTVHKKSRAGLIIGIISGFIVIAAALLYFLVFAQSPLSGQWYCEDKAVLLEFSGDKAVVYSSSGTQNAKYQYDVNIGEGTLSLDGSDLEFKADGSELILYGDEKIRFDKAEKKLDPEKAVMPAVWGIWPGGELGEVIELSKDGTAVRHTSGGDLAGAFTYDIKKGKGTLEIEGSKVDFTVEGMILELNDGGVFEKAEKGFDIEDFISAHSNSILGLWYDEEGIAGTVEFKADGNCTLSALGMSLDATYEFDTATGKGTMTFMGEDMVFTVKDGKLISEGTTYARTEVSQKSMEEMMEGLDDLLEDLD